MFDTLIQNVNEHILNPFIFLLMAVAGLQFIWGLVKYVGNSDNEEVRSDGRRHMLWGIIGIAIMISVFGIINFIADTIGVPTPTL